MLSGNLSPLLLMLGATELIVILVVVILLFGARKIPELMRGIGQGVNYFKQGMNETPSDKAGSKPSDKDEKLSDAEK